MTRPVDQVKPKKPKGSPLTPHSCGSWVKKIGGVRYYFGKWDDYESALAKYKREFPYLQAGVAPPKDGITLRELLNAYDDDKSEQLAGGKISERTYAEYMDVCEVISNTLGATRPIAAISPLDLKRVRNALAMGKNGKPVSPLSHKRTLTYARMVFNFSNEMLGTSISYRKSLASPEKRLVRKQRATVGERMFTADELRLMVEKSDPHTKAIVLLGVNCGFGPTDCIQLTRDRIQKGFINYARPKTGVQRRCPLWPETLAAIEAIQGETRVFDTKIGERGRPRTEWNRHMIARDIKGLCEDCGIYRAGITEPYALRRTFETIGKCADVNQSVIDKVQGHENPAVSEGYNQKVFDSSLVRLVTFIHDWMQGKIEL